MPREIEFRGWIPFDKDMQEHNNGELGEMVYTSLVYYKREAGFIAHSDMFQLWNEENIKKVIWMQYIGLKDANGKKAFHHDKVSAFGYSNWIIDWHDNGWKLKQADIESYQEIPDHFIVFGNIYENPGVKDAINLR